MKTPVCIFIGLQQVDAFLTLWATNHGFTEVNPLMLSVADNPWIVVVKLVPAIIVCWFLCRLVVGRQLIRRVAVGGLGAACIFLTVVVASNIAEIV